MLIRRLSIISLLLLVLLATLPLATLWVLGHSPAALQALVSRLPTRIGPIEYLAVEGVEGSIGGGFTIETIEIRHDLAYLQIRGIKARFALWPLLWQSLQPKDFSIEEFALQPQPRDIPPPNRAPFFLPGLVTADIEDVRIGRLVITQRSGLEVRLEDIRANGSIRQRSAKIDYIESTLLGLQLTGEASLTANRPLMLAGKLQASLDADNSPDWLAEAEVSGDLVSLDVDARLLEPFQAKLDSGTLRALPPWNLTGDVQLTDLDASRFGAGTAFDNLTGSLKLNLAGESWRAKGPVRAPGLGIKEFALEFEGLPRAGRLEARQLTIKSLESELALQLAGSFGLGKNLPRIALTGEWQALSLPLGASRRAMISSDRGQFTVVDRGDAADKTYMISTDARLTPQRGPTFNLQANGELSARLLRIDDARMDVLGGTVRARGSVARGGQDAWQLSGNMQNINPGEWREELPGRLAADFRLQGSGFGVRDELQLELARLSGTLRGAPASGSGKVRFTRDGSRAEFEALRLSAVGLSVALDGRFDPRRRDLEFAVRADDLSVLGTGGRGRLQAQGEVRGSSESMKLELTANAKDLALADWSIDRLTANINVDPVGGDNAPAQANIEAEGLTLPGGSITRLDYRMRGQSIQHEMEINLATATGMGLRGRGNGVFLGDQWRQDWQQLDLDLPAGISLALSELLSLRLTTDSIFVDPFCLRGRNDSAVTGEATLCGSGLWQAGRWQAETRVRQLPLSSVLPRPTDRISYDGVFNAVLQLSGADELAPTGSLNAEFERAALRRQRLNNREEVLTLGSGSLVVNATQEGLEGELEITAGNTGRALGILRAERDNPQQAWSELPLRATLQADSSALALLYLYVPEIDRSSGDLLADLIIGGTLGAPSVSGVLRLTGGELDFYQLNLSLRDMTAEARLLDNGFTLNSKARSGSGRIEADARLQWRDRKPFGDIRIRGDNLLLVDLPEARLTASPDLQFTVDGRSLQASGTVRIPEARLTPTDLTGAITVSDDERLIDAEPVDPDATFQVSSNLRLILGERVNLDSFGLSGRLQGDLTVQSAPETPTRALGELRVSEGRYAALGRQLDIERGRLQFSGGLLTDPAVDVRAVKVFPDVKAGVNVRGSLREPRLTFFSEPSLPQSQVVSLILAGGGLDNAQSADPNKAGRDALLAQGSAILAQQLGQRIGIDDVGIEQNLSNETSLVFGRYLSSRLYISYGISLAETINTLKMRYSINDRWTLRTEASKETSAEIVYTVEKN